MSLETELTKLNDNIEDLVRLVSKALDKYTKDQETHTSMHPTVLGVEVLNTTTMTGTEKDKPVPKKRKRRTKAEIERDKAIAECANVSTPKEDKPDKGTTWVAPSLK